MAKNYFNFLLYLLPLLLFLSLGLFLWRGLSLHPKQLPSALLNKNLPEFSAPNLFAENKFLTPADFKHHVVLLNIWASWCSACRAEHPVLIDLSRQQNLKLRIYSLNYKDNPKAAREFLQQFGNPYKITGLDTSGDIAINLGVYGTPESFIIDKNGVIKYRQIGAITPEIWQQKILPLVEKLNAEKMNNEGIKS